MDSKKLKDDCLDGPVPFSGLNEKRSVDIETALAIADIPQEMYLQYQPQVDLRTGCVIGAEALLRWNSPTLGNVAPEEFIPLSEKNGLIISIGEWVLKNACEAAVRWQRAGISDIRVAVNVSPVQINQENISSFVECLLIETGLRSEFLCLEITEDLLSINPKQAIQSLNELRSIGVQIALDRFGSDCSSINALRLLPIDTIKIEKSLVPDVTAASEDISITRAIINMAHALNLRVTAIGVDSSSALSLLIKNHCDKIQGNAFYPAVSELDFISLIKEKRTLPGDLMPEIIHRRTLLLVDDDISILSSMKRLLRRDGYHIITAENGLQGLECLAMHDVDVIISDQRMPGMSGVDFLRKAKEHYPNTMRMVLSGYTELKSVTDAINEGAIYKFLTKPWDDDLLRANIQEAFQQKELSRENKKLADKNLEANMELAKLNKRLNSLLASKNDEIYRDQVNLIVMKQILENIPAAVLGLDDDGLIVFANNDAAKFFGDVSNPLGMYVHELISEDLIKVWRRREDVYQSIRIGGRIIGVICRPIELEHSCGTLIVLLPDLNQQDGVEFKI